MISSRSARQRKVCKTVLVHSRIDRLDTAFSTAGSIALKLIRRCEVSDHWTSPSALPKMSVGALACHLGRQMVRTAELLPLATNGTPLDSADAHYRRAAWVTSSSPDDPPNDRSSTMPKLSWAWLR